MTPIFKPKPIFYYGPDKETIETYTTMVSQAISDEGWEKIVFKLNLKPFLRAAKDNMGKLGNPVALGGPLSEALAAWYPGSIPVSPSDIVDFSLLVDQKKEMAIVTLKIKRGHFLAAEACKSEWERFGIDPESVVNFDLERRNG